jgi:hypothetical protein
MCRHDDYRQMPIKCKISGIFHHDNNHDGGDQKKVHLERNNSALLRGEEYKCIWPHIRAHDEIPLVEQHMFTSICCEGLGQLGSNIPCLCGNCSGVLSRKTIRK